MFSFMTIIVVYHLFVSSRGLDALMSPLIAAAAAAVAHWIAIQQKTKRGKNMWFYRPPGAANHCLGVEEDPSHTSALWEEGAVKRLCSQSRSWFNSPHAAGSLVGVPQGMSKTIQLPVNSAPLVWIAELNERRRILTWEQPVSRVKSEPPISIIGNS